MRSLLTLLAWTWAAAVTVTATAQAQSDPDGTPTWPLSEHAEVSLLTIYPGDAVHALFGHTALRVRDPAAGIDWVYNYGTFDFEDPWFIPKFVRGQLDYQLSVASFDPVLAHYGSVDRPVVEQVLALTHRETQRLFDLLQINALPENRAYRYRFLADNCSTRPRDLVEQATGGRLTWGQPSDEARTYRQWLSPYLAGDRWLGLGIDLVMGQPADEPASSREAMFLPLPLMAAADGAMLDRGDQASPLVAQTRRLYWRDGADAVGASLPWPAIMLWGLFAGAVFLTWRFRERGAMGLPVAVRWLDAGLFAVAGLAGVVLALMWTATLHDIVSPNWNLLWAWPVHLLAAPLLLRRGLSPRLATVTRVYLHVAAGATVACLLAWPLLPQAMPAALWPFAGAVALRTWARARRLEAGASVEAAPHAE